MGLEKEWRARAEGSEKWNQKRSCDTKIFLSLHVHCAKSWVEHVENGVAREDVAAGGRLVLGVNGTGPSAAGLLRILLAGEDFAAYAVFGILVTDLEGLFARRAGIGLEF